MSDDKVRFTREQLYDLIWSKPITTVASEFGMSSVAFAKHVERMGIPRPGRGYWQQIAAGQRPPRDKLPKAVAGTPTAVAIKRHEPKTATGSEPVPVPQVEVATTLARLDPLAAKIRSLMTEPGSRNHGMQGIRGDGHAVLKVAPGTEKRALLLLDAIFRGLRARGHEARIRVGSDRGHQRYTLEAVIHGGAAEFWLIEHVDLSDHVLSEEEKKSQARTGSSWAPRHDFEASGRLVLETQTPWGVVLRKKWADGKKQRLEDLLGEVIVGLEAVAKAWKASDDAREQERLAREAAQRRAEDEQRRAAHRRALGEDLEKMAARWKDSHVVTAFLDAFEQRVSSGGRSGEVAEWLVWAREHAKGLDPLFDVGAVPKKLSL
jgi:hypothetical protein